MVIGMLVMAISVPAAGGGFRHLAGYVGSFPLLVLLGMAAGMFAIPVQVFLQTRPPEDQKGRMIAVMNLTNFIAILLSGRDLSRPGPGHYGGWLAAERLVCVQRAADSARSNLLSAKARHRVKLLVPANSVAAEHGARTGRLFASGQRNCENPQSGSGDVQP